MSERAYSEEDVQALAILIDGADQEGDYILAGCILDHLAARGWAKRADVLEGVAQWARKRAASVPKMGIASAEASSYYAAEEQAYQAMEDHCSDLAEEARHDQ